MREIELLAVVAAAFAFGYFLMTRLDRFFEENRQAQEREAQEERSSDSAAQDETETAAAHGPQMALSDRKGTGENER